MSDFLDLLKEKIIEKAMVLPYSEGTERIVTIKCNKAYKLKLENELTNKVIRCSQTSNHSDLSGIFILCGIYVRLLVDKSYFKPRLRAGYYDKRNN